MIRSRAEYIRLMMLGPAQAGTTAHAKLLADTMALAERQLSKVTLLTQSEASRCHEEILKLQIPQGDQARLMAAVDAKVLNDDMAIEKPKHRNCHGINSLNAQEWVQILRLDVNPQLKLMLCANKIRKLCMHNADEKTFLYFAALATVKVAIADEAEALAYVNDLKRLVRITPCMQLPAPRDFSEGPADLAVSHPLLYMHAYPLLADQPVQPQIDASPSMGSPST